MDFRGLDFAPGLNSLGDSYLKDAYAQYQDQKYQQGFAHQVAQDEFHNRLAAQAAAPGGFRDSRVSNVPLVTPQDLGFTGFGQAGQPQQQPQQAQQAIYPSQDPQQYAQTQWQQQAQHPQQAMYPSPDANAYSQGAYAPPAPAAQPEATKPAQGDALYSSIVAHLKQRYPSLVDDQGMVAPSIRDQVDAIYKQQEALQAANAWKEAQLGVSRANTTDRVNAIQRDTDVRAKTQKDLLEARIASMRNSANLTPAQRLQLKDYDSIKKAQENPMLYKAMTSPADQAKDAATLDAIKSSFGLGPSSAAPVEQQQMPTGYFNWIKKHNQPDNVDNRKHYIESAKGK